MSNPTSNFGWQMPTPTDLVTSLPADFEVFGQAVDSTLADLKGGTTGQVLSKNSNTDMDFVWVTDAAGDITGVTAGTGISGGGTSGTVTVTNSMATTMTTKGDLVPATGSGTFARLAAGANGETLIADNSTSTGLRYQNSKTVNYCLNSAFQIWQRGTSFTGTANAYGPDRWQVIRDAGAAGSTFSRQATGDTTNLPFIQYAVRAQRDSGNTNANTIFLVQSFESAQSIPLAGRTVTISFYARAGANYSSASSALGFRLSTGTGTDQNLYSGYTGGTNPILSTATLTTTWQRFQATATLPTNITEAGVMFNYTPVGTAGAADFFEVTGVQVEIGSIARIFQTATGIIQGELAACQRYYWQTAWNTSAATTIMVNGIGTGSTNVAQAYCAHPVTMRAIPSAALNGTANMFFYNGAGGGSTFAISAIAAQSSTTIAATLNFTSTGITANLIYNLLAATAGNGFISFSSEL